jgi:adenylate cyclase
VNYPTYDKNYVSEQLKRIADTAKRIAARDEAVRAGRLIPDDKDIPIGTGRRLKAAVLFLDISGFTNRPSNTAQEQEGLLRALSVFFTEMFRLVNDYSGVIEKNTGDGLMAYFEDTSESNGSFRAVACAMSMMAARDLLNPHIQETADAIDFRIGIDHGPITVARIGAPKLFGSIVAIGITANIANKILAVAKSGQIVLGEQAAMQIPEEWKEHCSKVENGSRFVYIEPRVEYPFYLYTGRWIEPVMTITPPPIAFSPPPPKFEFEGVAKTLVEQYINELSRKK